MTPSKGALAERLAKLRNDGSTHEDYMHLSLMRLHYEIQKLEDEIKAEADALALEEAEAEAAALEEAAAEAAKAEAKLPRSLWSRVGSSHDPYNSD
jgi:hypothetical protein